MKYTLLILAFVTLPIASAHAPTEPRPEPQAIELPRTEVAVTKPLHEQGITHTERACNCYNLLKDHFKNVPKMVDILARAGVPFGNVAVFLYPPTSEFPNGIPHVAMTTGNMGAGTFEIKEYNYHECKESIRTINFSDPNLIGFVTLN